MSEPHIHDPVHALSEADATGETAEILADIRATMRIPLVTSIWRGLAGIDGGLEAVWAATRPIMLSGQPEAALAQLCDSFSFPAPERAPASLLHDYNVDATVLPSALTVMDAYNRSNGLNLFALTALVQDEQPETEAATAPVTDLEWPDLPRLLEKDEIDPETWGLLERIKHLGATSDSSAIATLWRHLVCWPGLLRLIIDEYEPMQASGELPARIKEMHGEVTRLAAFIKVDRAATSGIPEDAMRMVENYVHNPGAVNRMVAIGHGVRQWLGSDL